MTPQSGQHLWVRRAACRRGSCHSARRSATDGIAVPVLLPGALDGSAFAAWVEQELVPCLRPGLTVVPDNLSVHQNARPRRLIEPAQAKLKQAPRPPEAEFFEAAPRRRYQTN